MFWNVLSYELRYRFHLISTWVYIVMFFAIAFLVANTAGGAFDGVQVQTGKSGEFAFANSPYNITVGIQVVLYFCTIVFAAIFGSSAVRDFETGSYELYFTKPVKPRTYYLGRFAGAYLGALSIAIAITLGMAVGYLMPYLAEHKIGPLLPLAYLTSLVYFAIPNLFLLGSAFFAAGMLSRKVINSYITGIGFFLAYSMASALMGDVEKISKAAILDPFGLTTLNVVTRYWTTAQSNTNLLSLNGILGWNRILWIAIGVLITLYAVHRFDFQTQLSSSKKVKIKPKAKLPKGIEQNLFTRIHPTPYRSFQQFCHLTWFEFKNIVFNRTFLVIVVFFAVFLFVTATQLVGNIYGTQTHPITSKVLDALVVSFYLFGLIISTFYAGDLLYRDKTMKMDQLYDVTPHHSHVRFFSKMGAIMMMQWVLLFTIIVVGVITQVAKGHYQLELSLYFIDLFVVQFIALLPVTFMLFFFGTVMNNKYAGYLTMILFYASFAVLGTFNINHPLLIFGSGGANYSEMNGYGVSLSRFFVQKSYWLLFAITLSFIAYKFWDRGVENSYRSKLQRIKERGFDLGWKMAAISFAAFLSLGGFLYYNMNILNDYTSPKKERARSVQYEKDYRERLLSLPQPRITEVQYTIDIFPDQRKMDVAGSYWLVNKNSVPVDTLVMYFDDEYAKKKLEFSKQVTLKESNKDFDLFIYSLSEALAPMDSIKLDFAFEHKPRGIEASGSGSSVMHNGTFFHNDIFPQFGYQEGMELSDNNDRKKKGLPPKLRMPAITDSSQYQNPYVNMNSDYVRYSATISTAQNQIAFAPGDLIDSWISDGRYHARYNSNVPVLNFFAFISGIYEKASTTYQDKKIEIYYDRKHAYNIESMLESSRNSLKYYSENFMPYPHKALRIVEVPYVYYAQSFPALIPFSENVGFIAKVNPKDNSAVDYPYQIVAHEIGHQWWAHTVIGANVQGSTMLSECFTEYSSLMVLKQKYGEERLRRYLNYVHDNYLRGRSAEFREEQALYLNENQAYLNYSKGTLVMFALQDYIGEKAVNDAIGAFCRDYAYHSNPFPLSTNALPYLKNALPDNLKYLATDLFETITLYDNKIISSKQNYDPKQKAYTTTISFSTEKARYDGLGKKQTIPVADLLTIAIYDSKEEKRLAANTIGVKGGEQSISLITKEKPGKVILDPFFKLIDTDRENNSQVPG